MSNKVSVIMPIYKVEEYLEKSINSVLNQTYTNFELILVDDGSPDSCPKICDEYAKNDDRIKVIHKQNGGLSSARNAGLDIATGKYVYFIDSDDYIESTLLETCVDYMDKGYDLFCFRHKQVAEDGSVLYMPESIGHNCVFINTLVERLQKIIDFANYFIPHEVWNKMFLRDVIEKNNLRFAPTQDILCEDLLFCISYISIINKISFSEKILYNYLQRDNSLCCNSKNTLRYNKINELLKEYYLFLKNNNLKELINNFYILFYEIYYNNVILIHSEPNIKTIRQKIKKTVKDYRFIKHCFKSLSKNRFMLYLLYAKRDTSVNFAALAEKSISNAKYYLNGNKFAYKWRIKHAFKFHKRLIKKVKEHLK